MTRAARARARARVRTAVAGIVEQQPELAVYEEYALGSAVEEYEPEINMTGAEILDTVRDCFLKKYAHFPSVWAADYVTLWAAHTHFKQGGVLIFRATPRLYLFSLDPGSGKSTVLEELNLICDSTFGLDIDPTQFGLQHTLSKEHATVLLDEGDMGALSKGTIAVINAGYTRNGQVLNGSGGKATRVKVFGPIALAALDSLANGERSESLKAMLTRGLRVSMVPGPHAAWGSEAESTGAVCKKALEWWAARIMDGVGLEEEPVVPAGWGYREAQIKGPLVAIADAAGGSWPRRVRAIPSTFPKGFADLRP